MKWFLVRAIVAIGKKVAELFLSRVADQTADNALNSMNNMKDFEHIFENLKKNSHELSARAADVEEQITNQLRSGQKKRKRQVEVWLEEVESIKEVVAELECEIESEGFATRMTDGGKAAQLDKQVEKLVEQSQNLGELVHDVCGTSGEAFQTRGLVGRAFGENVEKILRLLESGQVSSIGLYGMGGVGKTTLAQHINNRLKQDPERRVYWVTVSQEYTVTGLQDKIARLLGVNLLGGFQVGQRARMLQTKLSQQKSSVLILDDVWDNIDLSDVGCDSSVDGCKLIITTRSVAVCRQIGCKEEIPVEKLGGEEAWKLFHDRLGNEIELVPEIEIAKDMVKLCGGLPLAIITVARTMRGRRDSHRWRNAFVELKKRVKGHDDGTVKDEVFEVLKFSFDRLKEENDKSNDEFNIKQHCFLYCSLYPEDYQYKRDDLVRKFISGGLLDERRSRISQADQGHSILNDLVEVCLLESCVSDYNGEECVKMHDLVRSMALRICNGKYMVRAGEQSVKELPNEEEWTEDLEKVSLMRCDMRRIREGFSPDCPKLSTLLLQRNPRLEVIPESFFYKMQGLCTLDLGGNREIATLPDSISDLTWLKSLILEGCGKLEKVPYLGKMKALRELNLTGTAIEEVPQGLEELPNLRFLSVNSVNLKSFPEGLLLKLVHLQHLNLPLDIRVEIETIEKLKQLEEFGGGVKSVSDFNRFIASRMILEPCYRIGVNSKSVTEFGFGTGEELRDKNNLLALRESLLNKDEKVLGKGVVDLRIWRFEGLSSCFEDDLCERFDNPTSLKRLDIWRCRGIEWIIMSDDGQASQLSSTIEDIELRELDNLRGVVERREIPTGIGATSTRQPPAVFSFLKRLSIYECNTMRKMGLAASAVPNLEYISINSCREIQEIFKEEEEEGGGGGGGGGGGIAAAASTITTLLPKLTHLRLQDLPRLKRVSKATIISNSIQTIWIRGCPRLMKKFPLHVDVSPLPTLLQHVRVDLEWWESLEWDNDPHLLELLQHFLHFEDGDGGGGEEEEEEEEEGGGGGDE